MSFKQAERLPDDGPIGIERLDDDRLLVYVETSNGDRQFITVSLFNAARIFGALSVFLGINLPRAIGKAIKM